MDRRSVAITVVPLLAFTTLGIGLRIGASDAIHGARIEEGPRRGSTIVWQVEAATDDLGVREPLVTELRVEARRGHDRAEWRGKTNSDGVAEAILTFPDTKPNEPVTVDLRGDGGESLGAGVVGSPRSWPEVMHPTFTRATRREGEIVLDVAPLGGRLAVGFPGSFWVRATDRAGHALAGVTLDAEPEPGLDVPAPHVVTCENGWVEIPATPTFHVSGLSLHAKSGDQNGLWFGGVPLAGAASHVALPPRIAPGKARTLDVFAAGPHGAIYAEIDDAQGRVAAFVLEAPRAPVEIPPLSPGLYWFVTSSEPAGAASLNGGSVARPFLVDDSPRTPCDVGATLAASTAIGFPRTPVFDGFAGRRDLMRARRRRGVTIGLSALAIAAVLETLLLVGAARRGAAHSPTKTRSSPAGSVAVAILAALLGFALLAALLATRPL